MGACSLDAVKQHCRLLLCLSTCYPGRLHARYSACHWEMLLWRAHSAWLIGQKHTHQGIMHFQATVVIDETQLTELVHEVAHARPGRADHLSECLLTDL